MLFYSAGDLPQARQGQPPSVQRHLTVLPFMLNLFFQSLRKCKL